MSWNAQSLQRLPRQDGFYLRGNEMTRIEAFVAAAFAFCITLIMISGDSIPTNIPQTKQAMLSIPAFLFAGAQLIWIWFAHAKWSKRFGLEDGKTIMLSGILIMLVLVYVYPMRMMASGLFSWISGGYLTADLHMATYDEARFLFYFAAVGFTLLGGVFWLLNRHALSLEKPLGLTPYECHLTLWEGRSWLLVSLTSIVVVFLTYIFPDGILPFAPMFYASLGISMRLLSRFEHQQRPVDGAVSSGRDSEPE